MKTLGSPTAVSFTYDAEGRVTSSTGSGVTVKYFYDGEGNRFRKVVGSAVTVYAHDAFGSIAAEYSNTAGADPINPQSWNGYGYVGGNPLNAVDPSGMAMITYTPTSGDPFDPCWNPYDVGSGSPCWASNFDSFASNINAAGKSLSRSYYDLSNISSMYKTYCSGNCNAGLSNLNQFIVEQGASPTMLRNPCK